MQRPDPLAVVGIRLKVRRAHEQLHALESEVRRFMDRKPYAIVGDFNEDRSEYLFKFREFERPPVAWGVTLGEIVHNLRSALDHAIFQLTLKCSGKPRHGSGFPILTDPADWDRPNRDGTGLSRTSGLHQVGGTSGAVQAIVQASQPYATNPDDPTQSPLWGIHKMWTQDKHRFLSFAAARVVHESVGVTPAVAGSSFLKGGLLKDGAVVAGYRFKAPAPEEVKVNGKFAAQIVIESMYRPDSDSQLAIRDDFYAVIHVLELLLVRL